LVTQAQTQEEVQNDKGAINQVLKEIKSAYCNLSSLLDIDNSTATNTDIQKIVATLEEQKN
jgi:hypothetical protein